MQQSILVITVDDMHTVNVQYDDPLCAGVAVLWWLELAKTVVLEKLSHQSITKSWNQKQKQQEQRVSKEEMIWILLKTRKKIESRIDAVNKSDEEQSFIVDTSLFDQI